MAHEFYDVGWCVMSGWPGWWPCITMDPSEVVGGGKKQYSASKVANKLLVGFVQQKEDDALTFSTVNGKTNFMSLEQMTADQAIAVWQAGGKTVSAATTELRALKTGDSSKRGSGKPPARGAKLTVANRRGIRQAYKNAVIEAHKPKAKRALAFFPSSNDGGSESESESNDDDDDDDEEEDEEEDKKSKPAAKRGKARPKAASEGKARPKAASEGKARSAASSSRAGRPTKGKRNRPLPEESSSDDKDEDSSEADEPSDSKSSGDDDDDDEEEEEEEEEAETSAKRTKKAANEVFSDEDVVDDTDAKDASSSKAESVAASAASSDPAPARALAEPESEDSSNDDEGGSDSGSGSDSDSVDAEAPEHDPRCLALRNALTLALRDHERKPRGHQVDNDKRLSAAMCGQLIRLIREPPTLAAVAASRLIELVQGLKDASNSTGKLFKCARGFLAKMRQQIQAGRPPSSAQTPAKPAPATTPVAPATSKPPMAKPPAAVAAVTTPAPAQASSSSASASASSARSSSSASAAGSTASVKPESTAAPGGSLTSRFAWPADADRSGSVLVLAEAVRRLGANSQPVRTTADALSKSATFAGTIPFVVNALTSTSAYGSEWTGCIALGCALELAVASCAASAAAPCLPDASVTARRLPPVSGLAASVGNHLKQASAVVVEVPGTACVALLPAPASGIARPAISATTATRLTEPQRALYIGTVRQLVAELSTTPALASGLSAERTALDAWTCARVSSASVAAVRAQEGMSSVLEVLGPDLQRGSEVVWRALQ